MNWGMYNIPMIPQDPSYRILGIDEYKIFKKIILNKIETKKEFFFLDIGAGKFGLINSLRVKPENDDDIPSSIKIHLIGIIGEIKKVSELDTSFQKA